MSLAPIGVWLNEPQHHDRAGEIIDDFETSRLKPPADWQCADCREWLGREFGACWQCGKARPLFSD